MTAIHNLRKLGVQSNDEVQHSSVDFDACIGWVALFVEDSGIRFCSVPKKNLEIGGPLNLLETHYYE